MILGFTGTREGMTTPQLKKLAEILSFLDPSEVHHGDCVGADAQFDELAKNMGCKRISHPPVNEKLRAFCDCDIILPSMDYHARNAEIVRVSTKIVAAPKSMTDISGGTWWTINFAKIMGKEITIIQPDGEVKNGNS